MRQFDAPARPEKNPDVRVGPASIQPRDPTVPPEEASVCRNIRTLFNFEPPVTEDEIHAAALQFVRKVTGFNKPSRANEAAFLRAIDEIARTSRDLLQSLETSAPPRNRDEEAAKAKARAALRYTPRPS